MSPTAGLFLLLVAAALTSVATRPATPASRQRARARRVRLVERNPQWLNLGDVEHALSRSLPPSRAADVIAWSTERGAPARLLWSWIDRHGAQTLWLALAAGLTTEELAAHADGAAELDLHSLVIHSELRHSASTDGRYADHLHHPGLGSAPWG